MHKYAQEQNIPFTIASLQVIQQVPDTIVRVVLFHPFFQEHIVNVGEEASNFTQKYGVANIVTSHRAGTPAKVRTETSKTIINTPVWEELED